MLLLTYIIIDRVVLKESENLNSSFQTDYGTPHKVGAPFDLLILPTLKNNKKLTCHKKELFYKSSSQGNGEYVLLASKTA